jgi:arylsulfatase A-like enzyme
LVVWDTVRADRMSLYGHDRPTTPHLDRWATEARVFENCLSVAGYTLPSHASMFTGLYPSEHCTHNGNKWLDDSYTTLAELLRDAGYRTYLYSAIPNVSEIRNLAQGFDVAEHPWIPEYRQRAEKIIRGKLTETDASNALRDKYDAAKRGERQLTPRDITAAGELAGQGLLAWLKASDGDRPFFAFLNYMEAHQPLIPSREHRERVMSPEEVDASYGVDRS